MDPNAFNMSGVMPQGQMPMNHMQRPQPGNNSEQIYGKILEEISKNSTSFTGWQATLDIRERAAKVMEMYVQDTRAPTLLSSTLIDSSSQRDRSACT